MPADFGGKHAGGGISVLKGLFQRIRAGQPVVMATFGDSISEIERTPNYHGGATSASRNWGNVLRDKLAHKFQSAPWSLRPAGVGGHNTYEGTGRFLFHLKPLEPHLVLIAFGANDCGWHEIPPESTATALNRLLEDCAWHLPEAESVVITCAGDNPRQPNLRHVSETVSAQLEAARKHDVLAIDLRRAVLNATDNGRDWARYHNSNVDCHPNDAGHALWANTVYQALADHLSA